MARTTAKHPKKATVTRATVDERREYVKRTPRPVYPLYGWATLPTGVVLAVEDYGGRPEGDPNYEVLAPAGMIFEGYWTHTLLCDDLSDLRGRIAIATLTQCEDKCCR